MCAPFILAGMAVAGSISNSLSANAAASAQDKFGKQVAALNSELALETANSDFISLGKHITEQEEVAAAEIELAHKDSERLLGYMSTSAGEAGVGGESIKNLMSTIKQDELTQVGQTIRQLEFSKFAATQGKRAINLQTRGRLINGLQIPAPRVGLMGGLMSAGSAGVSGAANGIKLFPNQTFWGGKKTT